MKHIVVTGGGIAGKTFITELQKKNGDARITLVEPRNYMEVPYAQLRALVDPKGFSPKIRKNYSELFSGVEHINDRLTSVGKTGITLESGRKVDFDYLVIATGSSFKNWSYLKGIQESAAERQETVEEENAKLEAADSVLIIGGGPIGVELAGEIAHSYPSKKVTIVERGKRILGPSYTEKMTARAEKVLTRMGVEIHTNSYFKPVGDGSWRNDTGTRIEANLVFPAVGIDINTQWASASEGIELTDRGAVKVDAALRIPGRENIFALGDINNVPELKIGAFAGLQAKLTAGNIARLLEDSRAALKEHKPAKPMGLITLGPQKSAVQTPFGYPHFLGFVKQKDLFVDRYLKTR